MNIFVTIYQSILLGHLQGQLNSKFEDSTFWLVKTIYREFT